MQLRDEFIKRRQNLKEIVGDGVVLFIGNEESSINFKDNWYPFRQDSTFAYFFGLNHPDLLGVIDIDADKEIIFGDDVSIDDIVFTGPLPLLEDEAAEVGVSEVVELSGLQSYFQKAIQEGRKIHFIPPYRPEQTLLLSSTLDIPVANVKENFSVALVKAVVALRSIKSEYEVQEIEKAVNVTVNMHYKAMEMAKEGLIEADLYGAVTNIALAEGSGTSFPVIMTINGHILHNHYRGNKLKSGDMVLCDCGAEISSNYVGDLTRTFPVDEKFTTKQKEIYDIVYSSYSTAVSKLKPGELFYNIHVAASVAIVEGLISVGLMKGDPVKAVENGAHTLFFQCGLGHMMGMDVHDMENLGEQYVGYSDDFIQSKEFGFKSLRMGRKLEAGMVVTIEPGIYIIPELITLRKSQNLYMDFVEYDNLEAYLDFGGIRIEDDFLITPEGSRLLGNRLPSTSDEIEAFRKTKKRM
ncbi:Xaa-Pro aminopeptidase [Cellulophaga sp. F20128]|uniref:aminopeptidase P family protein n=1 Tax=Cellulophaga sp. F20128 TaxID=2926413 RepID=UPI001FF25202|nr:aminopeptidase P family protein [Cellulophaga sp. F20128]MCK0156498.1 Xaa-Pro aminopeptidase [Cellulophaga sp. F20128]